MTDAPSNVVPFGKYRGQPVEVMLADRAYCEWAMAQPGIRERYPTFVTIVVNGGTAPDAPTPEHNRMQLLFRKPEMRVGVYRSIVGDAIDEPALRWLREAMSEEAGIDAAYSAAWWAVVNDEIVKGTFRVEREKRDGTIMARRLQANRSSSANRDAAYKAWTGGGDYSAYWRVQEEYDEACKAPDEAYRAACERLDEETACAKSARLKQIVENGEARRLIDAAIAKAAISFEVNGWDLVIEGSCYGYNPHLAIELKPQMGDDYPAVMRAMKGRRPHGKPILIVDHFAAEGASLDDVKWIFRQSGIDVRTLAEIRAELPGAER